MTEPSPPSGIVHRQAVYAVGPRFFTDGEQILFEYVIDSGNRLGPYQATDTEREEHPGAWDAYLRFEEEAEAATAAETALHEDPEPGDVVIPEDWRALHWSKRAAIARLLVPGEVHNAAEAVAVIEAELKRRNPDPDDAAEA